jgi:hypothetical protein
MFGPTRKVVWHHENGITKQCTTIGEMKTTKMSTFTTSMIMKNKGLVATVHAECSDVQW